jgi:hypothetical protein
MKQIDDWKSNYIKEMTQAEVARSEGNEGMARVCARRAAGIVIGEYFCRKRIQDPGSSAYDRLIVLTKLPDISPKIQEVANHLILRVNPDHTLPIDVDLIAETRWLKHKLLD